MIIMLKKVGVFLLIFAVYFLLLLISVWPQVWGMMLGLWFITLPIAVNLVLAVAFNCPFLRQPFRLCHLVVFTPVLLTAAITWLGYLFPRQWPGTGIPGMEYVVLGLFFIHFLASCVIIVRMKGFRWFATSVSLFQLWHACGAVLMSAMAVAGATM